MSSYNLIGLMSGTSMDGLDISFINFLSNKNNQWQFNLINSYTIHYNDSLLQKLKNSKNLSAIELLQLDKELGQFFSKAVNDFIEINKIKKDNINAIASHGHTIYHQPQNGFTYQIGCGDTIAYHTGIKVINDFRQKDVIAGGQGAPLVPIGDQLLFKNQAEAFLNIGGFSNICYPGDNTKAYDICPGNLPLNYIAGKLGYSYDSNGHLSESGNLEVSILEKLNSIEYYQASGPKSLGTEWLDNEFMSILDKTSNYHDLLRTIVEHIAIQISNDLIKNNVSSVYITGGGAKNKFLIERIKKLFKGEVIIPNLDIIDYKESIIFAFLGALYLDGQANCLSSVTGADKNVIGGVLHLP